jgi:ribosomal protein S18 acetylase RimI-like enzyme
VNVVVRAARSEDLEPISRLAGELVRQHHRFDERRFFLPDNVEAGYRRFFGHERSTREAVILAAEVDGAVAGYAYGRLEPRDWNNLLQEHGAVHDIFVAPASRGHGVGSALMSAMLAELRSRGAEIVVLYTATQNVAAQRLFEKAGFRSTMIEMTHDLK